MIVKTTFGDPIPTDAITAQVEEVGVVRHFQVSRGKTDITFACPLGERDIVWGLGETMGRVNKRGGRYISFNTDTADHEDTNPSLYASHNFLIVDGEVCFGVFFDTPARTVFEIDWENSGEIRVICESVDLRLYQIENTTPYAVVRDLLGAIGRCYLPPLWAFGYGQSRFGYKTPKDFWDVVEGHREAGIPLDYICMDIDYMDRFIDFTVNKENL